MSNATGTITLTDFLLARIAEDEEIARAACHQKGRRAVVRCMARRLCVSESERGDRVLAECEAKRRIVEFHQSWPVLTQGPTEFEAVDSDVDAFVFRASRRIAWLTERDYIERFGIAPPTGPMLAALAAVYAGHPDYDEAWRP